MFVWTVPYITDVPTDTLAVSGDTVALKCAAGGSPSPTVTWRRNNVPTGVEGSSYKLSPVKASDTGWFSCVATNVEAAVFADCWLGVGCMSLDYLVMINCSVPLGLCCLIK